MDLTLRVKMLRDEFDEIYDFEDTIQDDIRRESQPQNISTSQVSPTSQVVNITPTSNTTTDSVTDDCITENQFPKIGRGDYFPT